MGYLNSTTVTVDAILTTKGRQIGVEDYPELQEDRSMSEPLRR